MSGSRGSPCICSMLLEVIRTLEINFCFMYRLMQACWL